MSNATLYPTPDGVPPSTQYEVFIDGQASFVYMTVSPPESTYTTGHIASWTSFDLEGACEVRIRRPAGTIDDATLRPHSSGIQSSIDDGEIVLHLDQPRKLAVECDGDLTDVLFLFANRPETDVPSPGAEDVIWFGPGVHEVGKFYKLKAGTTYYLAPGAFVKGSFAGGGDGTRIMGRGILSGVDYTWPGHQMERSTERVDLVKLEGNGLHLSGITLVDSPYYVVRTKGRDNQFDNLKVFAWYNNTDAISTGPGARIKDCFLRGADDIFKPFVDNTRIDRCVIWDDKAAAFCLTWNARHDSGHSVVRDCDIIHHMPFCNEDTKWTGAVFHSWHGGFAHIHDILFENIRIEGRSPRLLDIFIKRNPWSPQEGEWGRFSRLHFRNITVEEPFRFPSRLLGHDEKHLIDDVIFENVCIAGKPVRSADDMNLITNEFVRNVRFVAQ